MVNQLEIYGHVPVRKLLVYQRNQLEIYGHFNRFTINIWVVYECSSNAICLMKWLVYLVPGL